MADIKLEPADARSENYGDYNDLLKQEFKGKNNNNISLEDLKETNINDNIDFYKKFFDKNSKEFEKEKNKTEEDEDLKIFKSIFSKNKPQRKPKLSFRPPNGSILKITDFNSKLPLIDQDSYMDLDDISFLNHSLINSKKIVVVSGAGISVAAGIPDFRSSNGLFQGLSDQTTKGGNGKQLFDYQSVYRSPELMVKFHEMVKSLFKMSLAYKPTLFHKFLNYLSMDSRLLRLYTQNIDCFETQLSQLQTNIPLSSLDDAPKTIQLHGNVQIMGCTKCKYISKLNPEIFNSLSNNTELPICPECEEMETVRKVVGKRSVGCGNLRPRIVLYNEFHPDGEIIGSISSKDLLRKPDSLIIVGTTLKIPGVRRLVKELTRVVHYNKGCVIWINIEEPSMSVVDYLEFIDLIVVGDCQDIPLILEKYALEIDQIKKFKKQRATNNNNNNNNNNNKPLKRVAKENSKKYEKIQSSLDIKHGSLKLQDKKKPVNTNNPAVGKVTKNK